MRDFPLLVHQEDRLKEVFMIRIVRCVHLFSLVVWLGGMVFFTFFAAPTIFKVLPSESAGDLVGNIFPQYWLMGYICSFTALITLVIMSIHGKTFPRLKIFLLALMIGTTFYSGLVVDEKAGKIKTEIRITTETHKKEALRLEFKKIHGWAMILNMTIMILGLVFIYMTANHLRA